MNNKLKEAQEEVEYWTQEVRAAEKVYMEAEARLDAAMSALWEIEDELWEQEHESKPSND